MSMQSPAAAVPGFIKTENDSNLLVKVPVRKEKEYVLANFISNLNPANWFKEFAHIEITMEEFEVKRGHEVYRS
ncbi:MAG: hypothetical protein ACXWV6_14290 [Chitinophagaceae bacterium]